MLQDNLSAAAHSGKFFLGFLWSGKTAFMGKIVMAAGQFVIFAYLGPYLGLYNLQADNNFKQIPTDTLHAIIYFWITVLCIYMLRSDDRVTYGITELFYATFAFGIFYGAQQKTPLGVGPFMVAAGSCIYVAVRGLDNVLGGLKNKIVRYQATRATSARVAR